MSDTAPEGFEDPFAEQRRIREAASQETRHLIIQLILGHPAHLVSLAELDYMIPKNEAAILDQLERLRKADILDVYVHEPNASTRNLPRNSGDRLNAVSRSSTNTTSSGRPDSTRSL